MAAWLRAARAGSRLANTSALLRPIPNGMIGWWNFDDNRAFDASGNGNYGINGVTTAFGPSPYGQALYHNAGGNSGLTTPTGSGLLTIPFTWSAFVLQTTLATTGLIGATFNGTAGGLILVNTGLIRFSTTASASSSVGAFVANKWNHVACAVTATSAVVYVNGVQVASGSITVGSPMTLLAVGQASGVTAPANYADIRFFNRALSPAEIYALYSSPLSSWSSFHLPMFVGARNVSIIGASSALSAQAPRETISIFI